MEALGSTPSVLKAKSPVEAFREAELDEYFSRSVGETRGEQPMREHASCDSSTLVI
jgi:hypothetical protein